MESKKSHYEKYKESMTKSIEKYNRTKILYRKRYIELMENLRQIVEEYDKEKEILKNKN